MEQICLEQTLDDVVKIELVKASDCSMPIPFSVSGITEMTATIGQSALTIKYVGDSEATCEMDAAPTLTQKEKTQSAGVIITHELKATITGGFDNVRAAINSLRGVDFNIVMTTANGEKYLSYGLPNASGVSLQGQQSSTQQAIIQVTVASVSHIIRIS